MTNCHSNLSGKQNSGPRTLPSGIPTHLHVFNYFEVSYYYFPINIIFIAKLKHRLWKKLSLEQTIVDLERFLQELLH